MRRTFSICLLAAAVAASAAWAQDSRPAKKKPAHPLGALGPELEQADPAPFEATAKDGKLQVTGKDALGVGVLLHEGGEARPLKLRLEVSVQSDSLDRGAGLALELGDGSRIVFVLMPEGKTGVYLVGADGSLQPRMISGTDIDSTKPHVLELIHDGKQLSFYRDGERTGSFGNQAIAAARGKVGVAVLGDAKATVSGYAVVTGEQATPSKAGD